MSLNNYLYLFDPYSRDNQGFATPNGTSVLLKFNSLSDVEKYYKYYFLEQFPNNQVGYEYQHFNINVPKVTVDVIKRLLRRKNDNSKQGT